ncbi:MAG: methyltransferase domain-containing protein [Kiritimatiellae bacterium]|nr:methyltransferase domain-containing protein [Kiritimatiellia bacterium]
MNAPYRSPLYPSIFFSPNPFKALELNALLRKVDFKPGDVGLDVGSGLGVQTSVLATHMRKVIGIDVSENAVRRAQSEQHLLAGKGDVDYRCTSIEAAGLPDNSFDKVFSICVLEHIPDHLSVLRHCYRVLKPGGQLAFSVDRLATIEDSEAVAFRRQRYEVSRYFNADEIKRDFESVGFRNVQVAPLGVSPLAARWFTDGIRHEFRYRFSEAWWKYHVLKWAERFSPQKDRGIYLIVRADK